MASQDQPHRRKRDLIRAIFRIKSSKESSLDSVPPSRPSVTTVGETVGTNRNASQNIPPVPDDDPSGLAGDRVSSSSGSNLATLDSKVQSVVKNDIEPQEEDQDDLPSDDALWNRAFFSRPPEDQARIREVTKASNDDENPMTALEHGLRGKKEEADRKKWTFSFRGEIISVKEVLGGMITWLQRFKEIGDIAVGFDPVHAALPWAGVRFLIQIFTVGAEQSALLAVGLEKICYLSLCCQVYQRLYLGDGPTLDVDVVSNLEEAVVALYSGMLSFVGLALKLNEKNVATRAIHGLFNPEKLSEILEDLKRGGNRLALDSRACNDALLVSMSKRGQWPEYERLQDLLKTKLEPIATQVEALWTRSSDSELSDALLWISKIPFQSDHENEKSGRVDGTGQWLLETEAYKLWLKSKSSTIFWLHGIPGAGKTVLTSTVVDSILQFPPHAEDVEGVAYFYCSRRQENHRDADGVIRCLVKQLAAGRQRTDRIVQFVYETWKEQQRQGFPKDKPTIEEATAMLKQLASAYARTTIVVDGLDEVDEHTRMQLTLALKELIGLRSSLVRVFVASRNDTDLVECFAGYSHLQVEANHNQLDISKYVEKRIDDTTNPFFKPKMDIKLRQEILDTFKKKSNGMFQWAALMIGGLLRLKLAIDVRNYLISLPETLKEAYDKIYQEIKSREGSGPLTAERAIKWIMSAWKDLTPSELIAAVSQDPDEEGTSNINPDVDIEFILDACRNLIMLSKRSSTSGDEVVRFSHVSVLEYFEKRITSNGANEFVGLVCLQILTDQRTPLPTDLEIIHRDLGHYVCGWFAHICHCDSMVGTSEEKRSFDDLLQSFLGDAEHSSHFYKSWYNKTVNYHSSIAGINSRSLQYSLLPMTTPVFGVALLGLRRTLRTWLESGMIGSSTRNAEGETMLHLAAIGGSVGTCKELLEVHDDPNKLDDVGYTPLMRSILHGHHDVAHYLIETGGANPNAGMTELYGSALCLAVSKSTIAMVQMLLEAKADKDRAGGHFGTPLQAASRKGSAAMVHELLGHDADPNVNAGRFGTALQAAVNAGSLEIVQELITSGADVNTKGGEYGSALNAAAFWGRIPILEKLLDSEADVNMVVLPDGDAGYLCALHAALGRLEVDPASYKLPTIRFLFSKGATVEPLEKLNFAGMKLGVREFLAKATMLQTRFGQQPGAHSSSQYEATIRRTRMVSER